MASLYRSTRGSVMLIALILVMIVMAMCGAYLTVSAVQAKRVSELMEQVRARDAAEVGIDHMRVYLLSLVHRDSTDPGAAWDQVLSTNGGTPTWAVSVPTKEGSYTVRVLDNDDGDGNLLDDSDGTVILEAKGYGTKLGANGASHVIRCMVTLEVNDPTDNYAILTGGDLEIFGHEAVDGSLGSVHTNADLSLQGNASISQNATASGETTVIGGAVSVGRDLLANRSRVPIEPVDPSKYRSQAGYILTASGQVLDGVTGMVVYDFGAQAVRSGATRRTDTRRTAALPLYAGFAMPNGRNRNNAYGTAGGGVHSTSSSAASGARSSQATVSDAGSASQGAPNGTSGGASSTTISQTPDPGLATAYPYGSPTAAPYPSPAADPYAPAAPYPYAPPTPYTPTMSYLIDTTSPPLYDPAMAYTYGPAMGYSYGPATTDPYPSPIPYPYDPATAYMYGPATGYPYAPPTELPSAPPMAYPNDPAMASSYGPGTAYPYAPPDPAPGAPLIATPPDPAAAPQVVPVSGEAPIGSGTPVLSPDPAAAPQVVPVAGGDPNGGVTPVLSPGPDPGLPDPGRAEPLSFNGFTWNAQSGWSTATSGWVDGVYYIEGSIDFNHGGTSTSPWKVTLVAEGDIRMQGNPYMQPYLNDTELFVAGGDVYARGTGMNAEIEGLILAHEQIDLDGNITFAGRLVAESAVNINGSIVDSRVDPLLSSFGGSVHVTYNGYMPRSLVSEYRLPVRSWQEDMITNTDGQTLGNDAQVTLR